MLQGVDHVAIRAKDPGRLMDWYQKTFGLKVASTCFLKLPDGVMLEFLEAEEDGGIWGDKVSGIRHIAFRVEDFDAMVDLIQEEGLEIVAGPNIKPRNKAIFFRDPEGNILQFQYWIESPDYESIVISLKPLSWGSVSPPRTRAGAILISAVRAPVGRTDSSESDMHEIETTKKPASGGYVWGFLVLTCLLSWSLWLASGVLPRRGLGAFDFRWLFAQIGVFGPSLTALLISGVMRKELRSNGLRMLPVLLLPLVFPGVLTAADAPSSVAEFGPLPAVVTVAVSVVVVLFFYPLNRRLTSPGTGETLGRPGVGWILLSITFFPALFLLAWLLVNLRGGDWTVSTLQGNVGGFVWILLVSFAHNLLLGGPLGEEVGWRGFLLPQLLKRYSPLTASLILGVVWALWHLPIDLYAGYLLEGPAAILIRIITVLPLTILFTWFYLQSNDNLLVALFLHTSINILPDLGFSRHDVSMIVFVIFAAIAAFIVSTFSRVFRSSF